MNEIRKKENLHVVLWLIKDFAWISGYKLLGLIMAPPTILLAIYLTWLSKRNKSDFYHNLSICFWISANVIWMFGEFFYQDTKRYIAIPFFICGLGIMAFYYLNLLISKYRK